MSAVDDVARRLSGLLHTGLIDDPAARAFVEAVFRGQARIELYDALRRTMLPELLDPERTPAKAVPALLGATGWRATDPFVSALTERQQRRLAGAAIPLWRYRATRQSWADLVGVVAGRRILVREWFDLRSHTGSGPVFPLLPPLGSTAEPPFAPPEHTSMIWIEDPGSPIPTVEIGTVAGLLQRFRPLREHVLLYRARFVDNGTRGPWSAPDGGDFVWDRESAILTSRGRRFVAVAAGAQADWSNTVAELRIRAAGAFAVALNAVDADNGYIVTLDPTGSTTVYRRVAGVNTSLGSVAFAWGANAWIPWRFEALTESAGVRLRVLFGSYTVIEVVDATSAYPAGTVAWASSGSHDVDLQGALLYRANPDYTEAAPA